MSTLSTNKDVVFIVSGGRTGTKFMGERLSRIVDDCFSVHEPDVFDGFNIRTWEKIKTFGIYHMVVGRLLSRTGIRNLSQKFMSRKISADELRLRVLAHRKEYYSSIPNNLIIESYYQWYGILPILPEIFPSYKVLAVIRDPRDWVTSWMNFGAHFGERDWVDRLGFNRLNPQMIHHEDQIFDWNSMTRFQKLCWTWKTVYEKIFEFSEHDPNTLMVRYEDLFLDKKKERNFVNCLEFITNFHNRSYYYHFDQTVLSNRIHATKDKSFPEWMEWDPAHRLYLTKVCSPLMKKFGYGEK